MKSLLLLWGFTAILGVFTWQYSNRVLSSIKFADNVPVYATDSPIDFAQGQTKIFPDYQVQRAASIQGTLGVE